MKISSFLAFAFICLTLSLPAFGQERMIRNTLSGASPDQSLPATDLYGGACFVSITDPVGGEISQITFRLVIADVFGFPPHSLINPNNLTMVNCRLYSSYEQWESVGNQSAPAGVPSTGMLSPINTAWVNNPVMDLTYEVPFNVQGLGLFTIPGQEMGIVATFAYTPDPGQQEMAMHIASSVNSQFSPPYDGWGLADWSANSWIYAPRRLGPNSDGNLTCGIAVTVIPAPGAAALIGCTGIFALRRRRR